MRTVRLTVAIVATLLVLVDLGGLSLSQAQTILQNPIPALPNPLASKLGKSKLNAPLAAIMNPTPTVLTQSGLVQGSSAAEDSVHSVDYFLGIPYAAPPIGSRRWMPPTPHAKFHGVFQANNFNTFCPQPNGVGGSFGTEDCLILNVFRPTPTSSPGFGGSGGGSSLTQNSSKAHRRKDYR